MPAKEIVKKEISKKTGNTRITYSDGSTEIIAAATPLTESKKTTPVTEQKSATTTSPAALEAYHRDNPDITVTGMDSRAKYTTDQFIQAMNKVGFDATGLTNKQAQSLLYQKADPYSKAYMWGLHGDTNKGGSKNKYSEWAPKKDASGNVETLEQYKQRMASQIDEGTLQKQLSGLEPDFADNILGSRTATLFNAFLPKGTQRQPQDRPDIIPPPDKRTVPAPTRVEQEYENVPEIPAEFWLQDKIKTFGAANDMLRIKKYMPWQASYNPTLMDPTFYDPTRELASNASLANTSSQAISTYAGPQAMNARLAQVQGNASKNAADILGRYNNMNVGVANQFEQANAGIMNQFAANKADQATNLFDKTTIVNQEFDNSKAKARAELRQSYSDAITNRATTQALNSMQNQYRVDPSTGGYVNFYKGRPAQANAPANPSTQLASMIKVYMENGYSFEEAKAAAAKQMTG